MTKPLKNLLTDWAIGDWYHEGKLRVRGVAVFAQEGIVDAGEVLNTSHVVSVRHGPEGLVVETANSMYILVLGGE